MYLYYLSLYILKHCDNIECNHRNNKVMLAPAATIPHVKSKFIG